MPVSTPTSSMYTITIHNCMQRIYSSIAHKWCSTDTFLCRANVHCSTTLWLHCWHNILPKVIVFLMCYKCRHGNVHVNVTGSHYWLRRTTWLCSNAHIPWPIEATRIGPESGATQHCLGTTLHHLGPTRQRSGVPDVWVHPTTFGQHPTIWVHLTLGWHWTLFGSRPTRFGCTW